MVANQIQQRDETETQETGLVETPPQTTLEIARSQLEWLWNVFVDESGNERVEGATFALADIFTAMQSLTIQNDQLLTALHSAQSVAHELRFQRDIAALEAKNTARHITKVTKSEIAQMIAYELRGDYSPFVAERLLEVLTGEDDAFSRFTLRSLRDALEDLAEEIQTGEDPVEVDYGYDDESEDDDE